VFLSAVIDAPAGFCSQGAVAAALLAGARG